MHSTVEGAAIRVLLLAVMDTWYIRLRNYQIRLPDHYFPLNRNSIEGQEATCSSCCSREEVSIMQETLALSGRMYSGKSCGCRARGLLPKESTQTMMTSWHTSTLSCMVDSVVPSLGNLPVVMVQPSQDRNSNHPGSFVLSGTR